MARDVPVLEVDGVTAAHGRGATMRRVLAATSIEIRPGESVAVIGRSGAGKTTLADLVLGLRPPLEGSIRVCGESWCAPGRLPPKRMRHLVQGIPQDPGAAFVPRWSIRRSIARAIRALGRDGDVDGRIAEAAELAQVDPILLERRPSEVSGGQAQRAAIARALAVGPTVLVADEPTSSLDSHTAAAVSEALLSIVADSGIALLLVTHDPGVAERCSRTVGLNAPDGETSQPAA